MLERLIIAAMLILLLNGALFATESGIPQQISKFVDAWNANSYETAKSVLSPSYSIKGVPEGFTERVLQQAFGGHQIKIEIISYLSAEKHPSGISHTVLANRNAEEREMTFVIDQDGLICESDIFEAQVKQVKQEKAGIRGEYLTFEFELHENMILVEGSLDGEKVQFILDSGAPIFVLNSHFTDEGNRMSVSSATGVGGSISSMDAKRISHLSWPGGEYRDIDVLSMDLRLLEEKLGKPFAGLLSFAELEPYEVYIDYAKKQIHLYGLDEGGNLLDDAKLPQAKHHMPFSLQGHIPVLECRIGNQDIPLGLDTGAQSNLLDLPYFASLGKLVSKVEADTLMGADARMLEIKTGQIKSTIVSGKKYGAMRYAFSDISHLRDAYKINTQGLLGYPFLSRKPFSINYRKQVLSIY
jgi:hypothetical protein